MPHRNTHSNKGEATNSLSWAFMIAGMVTLPFYLYNKEVILWVALLFISVFVFSFFLMQGIGKQKIGVERRAS
jgi:hypothetical protein